MWRRPNAESFSSILATALDRTNVNPEAGFTDGFQNGKSIE
jgi:hypothetical protein